MFTVIPLSLRFSDALWPNSLLPRGKLFIWDDVAAGCGQDDGWDGVCGSETRSSCRILVGNLRPELGKEAAQDDECRDLPGRRIHLELEIESTPGELVCLGGEGPARRENLAHPLSRGGSLSVANSHPEDAHLANDWKKG